MSREYGLETRPYRAHLSQLVTPTGQSTTLTKTTLKKLVQGLKEAQTNVVLPIACATDDEEKYDLLTGFDIYEAAKEAEFDEMWVFIIAAPKAEAMQWIALHGELSKLNDMVIDTQGVDNFIKFINAKGNDLTSINGIGAVTAEKIEKNRPYKDLADVQAKLGKKSPLKWIRAYEQR